MTPSVNIRVLIFHLIVSACHLSEGLYDLLIPEPQVHEKIGRQLGRYIHTHMYKNIGRLGNFKALYNSQIPFALFQAYVFSASLFSPGSIVGLDSFDDLLVLQLFVRQKHYSLLLFPKIPLIKECFPHQTFTTKKLSVDMTYQELTVAQIMNSLLLNSD